MVPAVGKFNLNAYKALYFIRFSLMFLKGGGHIDGEILKTLQTFLNKISPSARLMTLAYHEKLYNNYIKDLNQKKLVL